MNKCFIIVLYAQAMAEKGVDIVFQPSDQPPCMNDSVSTEAPQILPEPAEPMELNPIPTIETVKSVPVMEPEIIMNEISMENVELNSSYSNSIVTANLVPVQEEVPSSTKSDVPDCEVEGLRIPTIVGKTTLTRNFEKNKHVNSDVDLNSREFSTSNNIYLPIV